MGYKRYVTDISSSLKTTDTQITQNISSLSSSVQTLSSTVDSMGLGYGHIRVPMYLEGYATKYLLNTSEIIPYNCEIKDIKVVLSSVNSYLSAYSENPFTSSLNGFVYFDLEGNGITGTFALKINKLSYTGSSLISGSSFNLGNKSANAVHTIPLTTTTSHLTMSRFDLLNITIEATEAAGYGNPYAYSQFSNILITYKLI